MQHPSPNNNYVLQPSFNTNYMQNPDEITNPTTAMNMALVLMAKAFKLNYSTLTKNNQRILSNPRNRKIAQPGMNMGQDRQMQMVGGKGRNQFRQYAGQNSRNQIGYNVWLIVGNPNRYNAVQNAGNQQHGLRVMTQLLIAQKEEAGIQLQAEEFDLMATAGDIEEIKEVNANCILMANLQQALTSGTQTDKALVYDSDESAEAKMDPSRGTVGQHPDTIAKTHSFFESLYNNLVIEVEKVNTVNLKMKEANADLTTELARYKEEEKYDIPSPSVARKLLNEVKDTIVTLQRVVNSRISLNENTWSSTQFLKEAAKFIRNFKSLAKEADESLDKITVFEEENERLLKKVVSQDTMSIVQSPLVEDTSDLQTELERTKEKFETCIIKKDDEYATLWNNWKFVFPADFIILQTEEDDKVPLILGRPFLHTADAIIRVKNKELNLGVGDDRIAFIINKAMRHSHSNNNTCFRMDVIDEVTKE
ncbi:integrase, catalytic region, zinc finger, CCHC-type containing protein [Tanacetum coccineum]